MTFFKKSASKVVSAGIMCAASLIAPASLNAADSGYEPHIFGYLSWCENQQDFGWYQIHPEGGQTCIWIDETDVHPAYFITGWVIDDKLCGIYGNHSEAHYIEYYVKNGEFISISPEIDIDGANHYRYISTGAYNPNDGYVYGFSYNASFTQDYFVKAPASDISKVEIIREMPRFYVAGSACAFNTKDNHLYCVDRFGDFIRIDVHGNFELAASYPFTGGTAVADYAMGMAYSPREDCFYWNRQFASFESDLVRIDAKTYQYTKVYDLPIFDHYTVMSCIDSDGHDQGPALPTLVSAVFEPGSDSREMTYTLPTLAADGTALPSEIEWTCICRPLEETVTGKGAPGSQVNVNFADIPTGEVQIEFYASVDDKKGASNFYNAWAGMDYPAYPLNLKISNQGGGDFDLTWDAVTTGAHGGYFDSSDVKYAVFVNGKQEVLTSDTSARIVLPRSNVKKQYTIVVYAYAHDNLSEDAAYIQIEVSNSTDYIFTLDAADEDLSEVKYFNPDSDNSEWKVVTDFWGNRAFFCRADANNASNDWLITPPISFTKTENKYEISLSACANSNTKKDEYIEVRMGTEPTPEAMQAICILPKSQVTGTTYKELKSLFDVPGEGVYYIGLHAISDAGMAGVYVKNMKVAFTDTPSGVNTISAEIAPIVIPAEGGAYVCNSESLSVEVYSIDGRKASSLVPAECKAFVALPAGAYVVRVGSQSTKVIVK